MKNSSYVFLERCLTSLRTVHSNNLQFYTFRGDDRVSSLGRRGFMIHVRLYGRKKRGVGKLYEKRIHVRRSGWRSHEEERQHEARIMHRGCIYIYIYRGKNSSLFTNWNNSILHARDLSFRDYATKYIYIYVYAAIQVPTLAFLYYLGSFPRRKRYLSPLRGQCIICSFVISI